MPENKTAGSPSGTLRELLRGARDAGPTGVAGLGKPSSGALLQVALDELEPNPWQYRSDDPEWVEELSRSLAEKGQIEAITYRITAEGKKQIIGGHSRWLAMRLLRSNATSHDERSRYETILANEKPSVSDEQMAEYGIIDNLVRKDPSLVDTARAIGNFQEAHGLTVAEVARRFTLEPDRAKRLLALNRAPERIKRAVQVGIMVQVQDDSGEPLMTEARPGKPARPRREHRTLDLMQALEIVSLQAFLERHRPERAEKQIEHLVTRVLEEGWTLRQVQFACKSAKEKVRAAEAVRGGQGQGDPEADEPKGGAGTQERGELPEVPLLFRSTATQLVVFLNRVADAQPPQKDELRSALSRLLAELK